MSYFCSHVTVFQLSFVVYSFYILVLYVHLHLVHLHISHISLHLVTSSLFSSFQSYHRVRFVLIFSVLANSSTFLIWSLISCSCANYIYVRFLKFISFWNRGVTVSGQIIWFDPHMPPFSVLKFYSNFGSGGLGSMFMSSNGNPTKLTHICTYVACLLKLELIGTIYVRIHCYCVIVISFVSVLL